MVTCFYREEINGDDRYYTAECKEHLAGLSVECIEGTGDFDKFTFCPYCGFRIYAIKKKEE